MKIEKRYIIGLIVFLVLLSLVVWGLLEIEDLNPNRHQPDIIRWVESRYDVKLKLGTILPIIYPGMGVEMNNIEVDLADPSRSRPELLKIQNLKAVIDLRELVMKKHVRVRDLILIRPEVYYEWGPAERQRLKNLNKQKNEQEIEEEAEQAQSFKARALGRVKKIVRIKFDPRDILSTDRILISRGALTVADFRGRPTPIPDMEFGDLEIGLNRESEPDTFLFWIDTQFPYSEKGPPGLKLSGKGRLNISLDPFFAKVSTDQGAWGEYPLKQFACDISRGEEKVQYSGVIESAMDAERLNLILSWPPLSKYNKLQPYQLQGHAEYIAHFHNGTNFWERFDLEQVRVDDLAMVLLSPKPGSKLKEPILFKKAKIFARNIAPDKPVPVQLSLPFPYQEPLKNLKPFPLSLDGVVTFDQKFTKVVFHADRASYGDNDFEKLDFVFSRGSNPWGLNGNFDLKADDLSQFRQILNWRVVPTTRNVAYMNFSGKGRITADFRYPDVAADGSKRLWYQGTAKLNNVYFDPGSVIAPINQFNGDVGFTAEKISMPVYWMHLLEMPVQSDMLFTYLPGSNPQFQFHTNANELDLAQVFMKRDKPSDPDIHPGDTLPGMRTVYMGDFQGQRVKYNKILLDEMKGQWKDKDRALGFSNITLKYHKGFYQDAGSWIDFRRANYIDFHFTGHFEDFPTRRMFEELFGYDFFVDGRATGQGNLSGRYIDSRLDYSSLNGYFKVQVVNGSLLGYNLGIRILQFLGFKIDSKKFGLDFEKGKAEVIIKNGVVYFDDLSLKSWNLEAHCAGKVDLVKHSVRIWVAAYPLEALSTVTQPIPLIGGLINSTQKGLFGSYAKAEGPWDSVSISAYLPVTEKVPTAPPPPEFPLKPWQ